MITCTDKVTCGETAHLESKVKISETAELSKYSFTWCKVKGITLEVIETKCKKYRGSSNRQLVIKEVCEEDEGDYQAVLSRESNGNTLKIFSNIIHLLPEGGTIFKLPELKDQPFKSIFIFGDENFLYTSLVQPQDRRWSNKWIIPYCKN